MKRIIIILAAVLLTIAPAAQAEITAPAGLNPGDTYHLIFVTSTGRDATSSDIADYNSFVQGVADDAGLGSVNWFAVASTDTVNANANAVVSAPVYLMDGTLVSTSADFYTSTHLANINLDEAGTAVGATQRVWSGSYDTGTLNTAGSHSGLGGSAGKSIAGRTYQSGSGWLQAEWNTLHSTTQPFYAISEELTVAGFDVDPRPADGDQAVDSITTTELRWLLPEVDSKVTVWFEAVGDLDTPIVDAAIGQTSITLAAAGITLAGDTNYTWRIKVVDSADALISDVTYTFKTSSTNQRPTVVIPEFYTWLVDDAPRIYTIDTVEIDDDDASLHTYTWSVVSGPAAVDFSPNGTIAAVDTNATFTVAGNYVLELEVDDNTGEYTEIGTVNVTVYADGCEATKFVDSYNVAAALAKGDFNHDCNVNLDDLTKLASKWLQNSSF